MKIQILLSALLLLSAFTVTSCKSHKTISDTSTEVVDPAADVTEVSSGYVTPLTTTTTTSTPTTTTSVYNDKEAVTEEISATEGGTLLPYSVVVGAFGNKTNATNYRTKMSNRGYSAFLVQNARGLWRVVAYTTNNYNTAVTKRDEIRSKYASDGANLCDKAWILKQ